MTIYQMLLNYYIHSRIALQRGGHSINTHGSAAVFFAYTAVRGLWWGYAKYQTHFVPVYPI